MNKKYYRRMSLIVTVMLLTTLVLSGCSKQPTSSTNSDENKEKVLVIGYERDAETLDHIKTSWFSDAIVFIFDRLVNRDYDFNYKPGLAKDWDISDDGLEWTFYLREGVKFHDGKYLTANDVKWTFDTIKDPKTASPSASEFESIEEVIVEDDYTVTFKLKYPNPNILFNLSNTASGIANKDVYEKYGDDYGVKYVIGSGPYMLEEWIKGDKLVLKKNPDYNWGSEWMSNKGQAVIDKIVMRVLPEENSRFMELEKGNIHIIREIPATFLQKIQDNDDINILEGESCELGYLAYACDKEPFDDVRVRQAINYAINKEDIVKYVFRDTVEPAYGYLPKSLKSEYYKDSEKDGYKYNVEKAKQLLKEAGYGDGLHLSLSADNKSSNAKLAEVLQSQLKQVGIDVDIRLYDTSSYTSMLKTGEQELFLREYSWPNADIIDWFLLSSQFPYPNFSRWLDPKTDEMLKEAVTQLTWEDRAEGYKKVQKYLIEQAVWAPIYTPKKTIAVRKEVKNLKYHPWMLQYNDGVDLETK